MWPSSNPIKPTVHDLPSTANQPGNACEQKRKRCFAGWRARNSAGANCAANTTHAWAVPTLPSRARGPGATASLRLSSQGGGFTCGQRGGLFGTALNSLSRSSVVLAICWHSATGWLRGGFLQPSPGAAGGAVALLRASRAPLAAGGFQIGIG